MEADDAQRAWAEFMDGVRRLLQDDTRFGKQASLIERMHVLVPMQEFLSANEVDELFCPPLFDEKQGFAARHFTGGLPQSAIPVESLYTDWNTPDNVNPLIGKQKGLYLGASARYIRTLIEQLGLEVPAEYADCPDHWHWSSTWWQFCCEAAWTPRLDSLWPSASIG